MSRFILDKRQLEMIKYLEISLEEALKKAKLPKDLLSRKVSSVTEEEYIRLMNSIEELVGDKSILPKVATIENIETFSPPIFAAYCSKNTITCIKRLSKYKKLIGPMVLLVNEYDDSISLEIAYENEEHQLPKFMVTIEMVFILQLIRNATKKHIVPMEISTLYNLDNRDYKEFFGVEATVGPKNILKISKEDALLPFISENDAMWQYFEPELKRRFSELEVEDTYAAKVRSVLIELLPAGEGSIDDVASKLKVSKRTLQRKLKEEDTTFQKQLNHTRELLARHYLKNSDMRSDDIAYLLGYQDLNSFIRAFNLWTGMTLSEYKKLHM